MVEEAQLLAWENAFAAVACSRYLENTCAVCFAYSCITYNWQCDCGWVYFCSERCAKTKRLDHSKTECNLYKRLKKLNYGASLREQGRLVIRILLKTEEELSQKGLYDRTWESLNTDEEQAKKTLKPSDDKMNVFKRAVRKVFEEEGEEIRQDMDSVINKVYLNGIRILDKYDGKIANGLGIFLGIHVNKNSCPSLNYLVFDGPTALLRSLDPSAEFTPETEIAFLPRLPFTANRKLGIRQMFGYDCKCIICEDPAFFDDDFNRGTSCSARCHWWLSYGVLRGEKYKCEECREELEMEHDEVRQGEQEVLRFMDRVYMDQDVNGTSEEQAAKILKICDELHKVDVKMFCKLSFANYHRMDLLFMKRQLLARRRWLLGGRLPRKDMREETTFLGPLSHHLTCYFTIGQRDHTNYILDLAELAFMGELNQDNYDAVYNAYLNAAATYGNSHSVTLKREYLARNYWTLTRDLRFYMSIDRWLINYGQGGGETTSAEDSSSDYDGSLDEMRADVFARSFKGYDDSEEESEETVDEVKKNEAKPNKKAKNKKKAQNNKGKKGKRR